MEDRFGRRNKTIIEYDGDTINIARNIISKQNVYEEVDDELHRYMEFTCDDGSIFRCTFDVRRHVNRRKYDYLYGELFRIM